MHSEICMFQLQNSNQTNAVIMIIQIICLQVANRYFPMFLQDVLKIVVLPITLYSEES